MIATVADRVPARPAGPPRTGEAAADRITRRLALAVGLAGTIAAVLDFPELLEHREVAPDWTAAAAVLAFVLFPVLAAVSIGTNVRVVRQVAGALATCYLVAAAAVSFAYVEPEPEHTASWMFRVFSLGVLAASLAWRPPVSIAYLLGGNVLLAVGNLAVVGDMSALWYLGLLARSTGLCSLFLWCSIYAQAGAARVDRETAEASARAARAAGAAARDRERARFAALIHDAVLSTLLDASRAGTSSPVLREQAARTLAQLDELRVGSGGSERFDADAVAGFLTTAVREVDPGIGVLVRRPPGSAALRMPVDAAGTMAAAAAEAVRNSVRHAGAGDRPVHRGVTVELGPAAARLVLRDDGAGFDPAKVPADRLGVAVSILGRMRSLPGGDAELASRPGQGTTVTLSWHDPEQTR
ncbi:ATP-binding protein [Nocardia farcinica]|uniref:Signal transduction histidine kinase, nitrate /nitrite-specific n=1 Tax=Nocardia farcinica TaxID=37329 RepID=A0A0H5NC74_NOCFR|nr:ATP-binding protein [Nocardia farcinica]AXK88662.1 ATP-binding protein [Nocardia farcinica]PFX04247.1 hypothetical protein CJ469_02125 [Nocardia farcinica]PFX06541.1 hypothetical protein CJ468_04469 [Nocardia farcinica]CRY73213.1 Signal transduction histidine kinase%2C nitrate /nitrite-specific [Nocardia farcinica]SIT29054.1 Signal transduction histidine kinase [Nocardia farcinica]